jgi:hypothetical protein
MSRKKRKRIIISLIRDGLVNLKLLNGLKAAGLDASDYNISVGDTIFVLMGFKNDHLNDLIFENVYLAISERVKYIDFSVSMEKLDALSEEIYSELLFAKEICDIKSEKNNVNKIKFS